MAIPSEVTLQPSTVTELENRVAELEKRENILLRENKYLHELFDRSPLGYQSLDENGCLIETNQAWLDILGYDKQEVIGRNFRNFLISESNNQFRDNFPKLKAVGEISGFEFEMRKKDGSHLLVRLDGRVGKNNQGEFQQTYCIIQDITLQKKADEEREILQAQLLHVQKTQSLGLLAGGIAHDFNNILSSVIGYTEIVLDDELPEDSPARDSIEQVLVAGLRAKDLVEQILTYSRHGKSEKRPISLMAIVTKAIKLLQASLPTNIDIQENIVTDKVHIFGDPGQVHQVIMNLGTNAGFAMRATGGMLEVTVSSVEFTPADTNKPFDLKHGSFIEITVTDTGPGINPAVLDKIFDPFFSTKSKTDGTGLGLSVVYGIVKNHNGSIIVNSEMKKGTVFKVYLPQLSNQDANKNSEPNPSSQLLRGNERILLVDDEGAVVDMMRKRLERLGYKVTMTTSSQKALEIFTQNPQDFDLVITDQTMPVLTGDNLTHKILSLRPDIPVILCTGYSHVINRTQAKEMGLSAFLMKPIVQVDLAKAIRKALSTQS